MMPEHRANHADKQTSSTGRRRILLGVNVDHVATLRQARGTTYPDPLFAALLAEQSGADGITVHPREDGRHIQIEDVRRMRPVLQTRMNLEMGITERMLALAEEIRPAYCCLVPEKREELTTEGGLDVVGRASQVRDACQRLGEAGIDVSLFIDPEQTQIEAARLAGAPVIELHTGRYAEARSTEARNQELAQLHVAARYASALGLVVNAGHGLHFQNVEPILGLSGLHELNIGHSLIAQAIYEGLPAVVKRMRSLLIRSE